MWYRYINSLSIFFFTSFFFYYFLSLFLHQTKALCRKRLCLTLPCASSYRWVHSSRVVPFCQPHQQLFTHSFMWYCVKEWNAWWFKYDSSVLKTAANWFHHYQTMNTCPSSFYHSLRGTLEEKQTRKENMPPRLIGKFWQLSQQEGSCNSCATKPSNWTASDCRKQAFPNCKG